MTSKERIEMVVNAIGGRAVLAKKLGVRYQTINSWYTAGIISMPCVKAVHSVLPWVNLNWLIFGEGDMYIYGKESKRLKKTLEDVMHESEQLKKILKEKINELETYELRTSTQKVRN